MSVFGLPDRIEDKISPEPNSGCWCWLGGVDKDNYGRAWDSRLQRDAKAHRLVYELLVGPIPADRQLCHTCDNPYCVNPEHMFVGTNLENCEDCKAKGRNNVGVRHGSSKLSEAEVISIRASSDPARKLAAEMGISLATIYHIRSRRVWKHLEEKQ
jgi:hypothetical protein